MEMPNRMNPTPTDARLYSAAAPTLDVYKRQTEPGIDMIKLIARELDVPVTRLLDMPEHYCQSCGCLLYTSRCV